MTVESHPEKLLASDVDAVESASGAAAGMRLTAYLAFVFVWDNLPVSQMRRKWTRGPKREPRSGMVAIDNNVLVEIRVALP